MRVNFARDQRHHPVRAGNEWRFAETVNTYGIKTVQEIITRLRKSTRYDSLAVVGLGNRDRADDGFGLQIVSLLKGRFPHRVYSEEERSIEGVVLNLAEREEIQSILFLDAASFSGEPGEIRLFSEEEVRHFVPALTTHKVPMTILVDWIIRAGKMPLLLGIQPECLSFMARMSSKVEKICQVLVDQLGDFLDDEQGNPR